MIDIGLSAIPNQALSIQLDERFYDIELRTCENILAISIARDGVSVVSNHRITPGTPILPYLYQENGNFVFLTDNESLPSWDQLGVTQSLTYLSAAEVATYRGA